MNAHLQNNFLQQILDLATFEARDLLTEFAASQHFLEGIQAVFGNNYQTSALEQFQQQWLAKNFADFPEIEIRSAAEINNANGAFSADTNKIYLAKEFITSNSVETVAATIVEEYGHYIDRRLNINDTPGDEGAIFSATVRQESLDETQLHELRTEDDTAVVVLDSDRITIEQNVPDTVLFSQAIDFDEYEFNFQTANYLNRWAGLELPNTYRYNSGNDFVSRLNFGGNEYSVGGGLDLGIGRLEAEAGLRVAPGHFEAGLQVDAGYNLGEFGFDIPLAASIEAGITNNQLSVDIDTDLNLPQFTYTSPYAYAYLDAVMGYDFRIDGFFDGFAEVGVRNTREVCDRAEDIFGNLGRLFCETVTDIVNHRYDPPEYSQNLIAQRGRNSHRLVQLDTRSDDNYIDYGLGRIEFGNTEGSVPRSRTEGYIGFDYDLPSFNNPFQAISSPIEDEYMWEIAEETTIAEADFAIDNVLAQIPWLSWLSQAGSRGFDVGGYNFGIGYDWRAIALDLSANLNFGYSFKTGVSDLLPQISSELSELSEFDFSFTNLEELEALDTDDENDIDITLEFDPTIIFEADAYLRPELNFDWDIGVIGVDLSVAGRQFERDFTVREGERTNLASTTIPIIPTTRREVKFSEIYRWLFNSEPTFTRYNLEIPFSSLDPERYGSAGDDFFAGTPGNDPAKLLGAGSDRAVVSEGNNGNLNGQAGFDTLIINRAGNYTLSNNLIVDSNGNQTPFENFELLELIGSDLDAAISITGDNATLEVAGVATPANDTLENLTIRTLQTGAGDDVITGVWSGLELETGEGNDTITLSKQTINAPDTTLTINTDSGSDTLNLTIVPLLFDSPLASSQFNIDLGTGNDILTVRTADPGGSGIYLRTAEMFVSGAIGGKTIDVELYPGNNDAYSEVRLAVTAPTVREIFALEEEAEIDRLFINVADSNISYSLDDSDPEAPTVRDRIVRTDRVILDVTDPVLPASIQIDPLNFNANTLQIDGNISNVADIALDLADVGDINNAATLEINGSGTAVSANAIAYEFLERKLIGEFRTLDFSSLEGGVSVSDNFLTYNDSRLDVFELVFTEETDTVLFTPDSSAVTSVGSDDLRDLEALMSFQLGAGDDRFHDRAGFRDSLIYPGSGDDSIYGAGGFDEVFYEQGSRLDYEIREIDERTIEVYYRPEDSTDILIDVERIDFSEADEFTVNPYWQGPDPTRGYTTFTLQVDKEFRDWDMPPFIYSPWTNLVPFGTTEVVLTKEFLLSNIYDAEGDESDLEISYVDVSTDGNADLNPTLDTTDPDADVWRVTILEGLNDGEQAVVFDYMVDDPLGSSQGNFLYIYPSENLSYASASAPLDLTTSDRSEFITATEFSDILSGNSGDDSLAGLTGDDSLQGSEGNDTLTGHEDNDTLEGGAGEDQLDGNDGNDLLDGGADDDTLTGHLGGDSDRYDGGSSNDLLTYETANTSLSADLEAGTVQNGDTEEDTFSNIENFSGSQADDTITGSATANVLNGLAGSDRLEGKEGNDTLEGRDGNDTLIGNEDDDQLIGGNDNDLLQGDAGIDVLEGNDGNDTLDSGSDSDLLRGGAGDDTYSLTLAAAAGDIIEETAGTDTLILTDDGETVTIALSEPTAGQIGIVKRDTFLAIDLNRDGTIVPEDDLTIADYFAELDSGEGAIENINNLSSADIREFFNIPEPLPSLSINDLDLEEGDAEETEFSFTVSLDEASEETITVDVATTDDTAIAGEDYTAVNTTLEFAPGETSKTLTVRITGDSEVESDESFTVNLSNPNNATLANGLGTATIINDDLDTNDDVELQTIELFRFRNTIFATGTYIFVGAEERDNIQNNPDFNQTFALDGVQEDGTVNPAFKASLQSGDNLIPFYRLRNIPTPGTYLFVSTEEYNAIFAENSEQKENWVKEGLDREGEDIPEFYFYDREANLGIDFNRFQNTQNNTFLYAGPSETADIENNPNFASLFANQGGAFESLP